MSDVPGQSGHALPIRHRPVRAISGLMRCSNGPLSPSPAMVSMDESPAGGQSGSLRSRLSRDRRVDRDGGLRPTL
jgi:hypothetical protein